MDPCNILSLKAKKSLSALSIDSNGFEAITHTTIMQTLEVDVKEVEDLVLAIMILQNGFKCNIVAINMDLPFALLALFFLRSSGIQSKFIGFTSQGEEMIPELLRAGLDHCMAKPVGVLSFAEVLKKIVDNDEDDD